MTLFIFNVILSLFVFLGILIDVLNFWIVVNIMEIVLCIFNIKFLRCVEKTSQPASQNTSISKLKFIFIGIIVLIIAGYAIDNNIFWRVFDIFKLVVYSVFAVHLFRRKKQ